LIRSAEFGAMHVHGQANNSQLDRFKEAFYE
jgi:hypothetical protein